MAVRRAIPLFVGMVAAAVLAGCGKGPAFSAGSAMDNPAPSANVSIAFQSSPPASVPLGFTTALTAVVSNDPNNYGVDWSLTCAATECGQFSVGGRSGPALHTQSGQAITYTPPLTFAGNQLPVTIVAFATADHTKNVPASIAVTAFLGNLHGTYVFQTQGSNNDGQSHLWGPYRIAGVVTLDGNGGVVGGEQTFADSSRFGSAQIGGGSYTVSADGRGNLTLDTNDTTLGKGGTETFSFVFLNGSESLITQTDGASVDSAAGTMELQTGTAALSGTYAFAVSGVDSDGVPTAFGGVLNIDQPASGTISGNGSVADQGYLGNGSSVAVKNCSGPAASGATGLSGTILPLPGDSFGAVQLRLQPCFSTSPLQFMGYMVDAAHIKLIETDITPQSGSNSTGTGFATAGVALSQAAATGGSTGGQSFSGAYVFGISGLNGSKGASSLAAAGRLVADGAGNLQGVIDEFGLNKQPAFSGGFAGTYPPDSSGVGRLDASTSLAGASAPGPQFIFYLTGPAAPALVLDFDLSAPAVGVGIAYAQAPPPLQFSGDYGLNAFTLKGLTSGLTNDLSGQMTVTVDPTANLLDVASLVDDPHGSGYSITGSFQATATDGGYSGNIATSVTSSGLPKSIPLDLYLVDDSHGFLVETDSATSGSVFLGYAATRTPVCPVCP